MLELLTKENIHIGQKASGKHEVIALIGEGFYRRGFTNRDCTDLFARRESEVSTFLGNGIALPHLPKNSHSSIVKPGIEIFQFPDGVKWDKGSIMFLAIGVVSKDHEHIQVLKEIAEIFSDEIISNALSLVSNSEDFLKILHASMQR